MEQGQITERYTRAIEQLGSSKLAVRIGGIYALERVARDSVRDHPVVMEVLATLIREQRHLSTSKPRAKERKILSVSPDVQAAASVIGRRNAAYDSGRINLSGASLADADLRGGDFAGVDLSFADLRSADLTRAKLSGADLAGADLYGTRLIEADLSCAQLHGAKLSTADLVWADLTGADLTGARLDGSWLGEAKLNGARLNATDFTGADLRDANLTDAVFLAHPEAAGPTFTDSKLDGAIAPPETRLPEGWVRDSASGRLERGSGKPQKSTPDHQTAALANGR
jgi:hypothetical protein